MAKFIKAHVTGNVWKVEVKVGDTVAEGDVVVILESERMEIAVEADADGRVAVILALEGQPVTQGQPLIGLE
jgi:acetyl-CoA carboxylase biotin carboxyl carrier protein